MRDQYAGGITDLLKIALLRVIAAHDRKLGVAWYYNPAHDGFPDGRHREFCDEPKWKSLDAAVWNGLRALPERSVSALERLPIWPKETSFHRVPISPVVGRTSWATDVRAALERADIVFLDPDNGVGKATEGTPRSKKLHSSGAVEERW